MTEIEILEMEQIIAELSHASGTVAMVTTVAYMIALWVYLITAAVFTVLHISRQNASQSKRDKRTHFGFVLFGLICISLQMLLLDRVPSDVGFDVGFLIYVCATILIVFINVKALRRLNRGRSGDGYAGTTDENAPPPLTNEKT